MSDFSITPKKTYKTPSYPSPKTRMILGGAVLTITAGFSLLSSGCVPPRPWEKQDDIMDGVAVECLPGDLQCVDDSTIDVCRDDEGLEHWETVTCLDLCREEFGPDYYPAGICDESQTDNPCHCEYDIIDGEPGFCSEDDFYCSDDDTINVCNDSGTDYTSMSCDDYCAEQWGSEMFISSGTCAPDEEGEPCNCFYGMLDGMMAECTPNDVICVSDLAMGQCDEEGVDYTYRKCTDVCRDLDPQATSAGCDATQEGDPCLCDVPEKK